MNFFITFIDLNSLIISEVWTILFSTLSKADGIVEKK